MSKTLYKAIRHMAVSRLQTAVSGLASLPVKYPGKGSKRRANRGDAIHNLHRFKKYFKTIAPYGTTIKQDKTNPTTILIIAPNGMKFHRLEDPSYKYPTLHANFEGHYVTVFERIKLSKKVSGTWRME